ncbi:hypothetical protein H311_00023, partial [Anncaliia algerae PRA109]
MLILCLIRIVISSKRSEELLPQKIQQTQELLQMIGNGKLQEAEDIMIKTYKLNNKECFKDLSEEEKKEMMIHALNNKLKRYKNKLKNESSCDLSETVIENNLSSDELFNKRNTKLKKRESLKKKLPRNISDKQNQIKDKLIVITHSTLIGNNFTEISIAPKKAVKKESSINDKERESSDREYIMDLIKTLTETNEVPHINIKKKEPFKSDCVKEGMNASKEEIKKEENVSNIDDKSLINNRNKDDTNLTDKVIEIDELIKENKSNDQVMSSNELSNNELTNALEPLVIINNNESNNSQLNDNSLTNSLEPMVMINNNEEINDIQRELSINNELINNELNNNELSNNNDIGLNNNFINKYFIKLEEELEN